jgi:hypothetical protein
VNRPRLAALGAVLLLAASGPALAEGEPSSPPTTTRFFLANDGADCGANDAPHLVTTARTTDLSCGYIGGGLPFGEVFEVAEQSNSRSYGPRAGTVPTGLVLDATKDVTGVIAVRSGAQQGVALPGGGEIVAEVSVRLRVGTTNRSLGDQVLQTTVTPQQNNVTRLPFTFDVPDTLKGTLTGLDVTVTVRGKHVFHGFTLLNGNTFLDVPAVPVTSGPTA